MAKNNIFAGLDVGTSTTRVIVAEENADHSLTILATSEVPTQGMDRGEVTDVAKVYRSIEQAIERAQDDADVDINSIYLAVTGQHIIGENNQGSFRLPEEENIITKEYMNEAAAKAKDKILDSDRFRLHRILGLYSVDDHQKLTDPLGLTARTLDINCHIIHGINTRIAGLMRCAHEIPVDVADIVFAPIATAHAVLTNDHKYNGVLLLDIGAGTTDYVMYADNELRASGCVPFGGRNITSDIHLFMGRRESHQTGSSAPNIPIEAAELLKRIEGDASGPSSVPGVMASLQGYPGLEQYAIERNVLDRCIYDRLKEIFETVKSKIPANFFTNPNSTILLCGGASQMRGIGKLATEVFGVKEVYHPNTSNKDLRGSRTQDPAFCTAVGLIYHAQILEAERKPPAGFLKRWLGKLFGRSYS